MITLDMEQGTDEWNEARCGIPTASNFSNIVTSKGVLSASAKKYMYKLAGEAVCGKKEDAFQSQAMIQGVEREEEARQLYEMLHDVTVERVGFCLEDNKRYGASPDYLIGGEGLLELKCPLVATHVGYLIDSKLPTDYVQQVYGQLLVTGRKWCDFMSYYPGIKPFIIRVERNEDLIGKMEAVIEKFCDDLEATIKKIRS